MQVVPPLVIDYLPPGHVTIDVVVRVGRLMRARVWLAGWAFWAGGRLMGGSRVEVCFRDGDD